MRDTIQVGAAGTDAAGTLRRRTVGLPAVLFQSVTFMAPAGAVAASIPVGANFAGLAFQFVLTLAIGIPLASKLGPVDAFILLATILTAVMMGIYAVFNLSRLVYYLRFARQELNWFLHLVVPVVGLLAIIPGLFVALGIGASVVSFISPLPDPVNKAGPILAAWFAVGVGYFVYLRVRRPARLTDMQHVFE